MKRKNTSVKKEFVNALASFVSYDAFIADIISILATLRNDKRDPDRYEPVSYTHLGTTKMFLFHFTKAKFLL